MNHPSDLRLEEHLLDRAKHADHIAGCARCQARLAQMEAEGRHFHQFVYPATLAGLEKPRRSWRWLLAPLGVAAMAALVVVAQRPRSDYVGTKGLALKLTIYTQARALNDGDEVPAAAALRFRVHTSEPCQLTLSSVDDRGETSRIHQGPAQGDAELPGGVVLDGKPGTERFTAVCSGPSGSAQASVLLKKIP
jgi:hypothetical protein